MPRASLIISNHNGCDMLRDCLRSLMLQNYPNFEVVVVDAGSDDGAPEMVEREFPRVRLVRVPQVGIGEAVNIGIRHTSGQVIAFDLNNDELFSVDWLSNLVRGLLSAGREAVVGGTRILHGTNDVIDEAGVITRPFLLGRFVKVGHRRRLSEIHLTAREVNYVGCPMFWRDLIRRIGPCDETYFFYWEDSDFCYRAKAAGYRTMHIPSAISYHRMGATIGDVTPRSNYFMTRGRIRFLIKYYPFCTLLPALIRWIFLAPAIDALMIPRAWIRARGGRRSTATIEALERFETTLSGLWCGLVNLKMHVEARRKVQALSKPI